MAAAEAARDLIRAREDARGELMRARHRLSVEAGPGDLVFKPRNQWHTFWNAGDQPCRILELISPAGFEPFFQELVQMGGVTQADPDALAQLSERYALQMRPDTVPELLQRFGLQMGEPLAGGWSP